MSAQFAIIVTDPAYIDPDSNHYFRKGAKVIIKEQIDRRYVVAKNEHGAVQILKTGDYMLLR